MGFAVVHQIGRRMKCEDACTIDIVFCMVHMFVSVLSFSEATSVPNACDCKGYSQLRIQLGLLIVTCDWACVFVR